MQINSNNINNTSFGSIYKYDVTGKNQDEAGFVSSELWEKANEDYNGVQIFNDFPSFSEIQRTGVFEKVHVSADDKYDNFIESLLIQNNINFTKVTHEEALDHDNIYNRLTLSEHAQMYGKELVSLDTAKIDELFARDEAYISPNGESGTISDRYQGVIDYLQTGRNINATEAVIHEQNGKLQFTVLDGRHRFAVMRDMGMQKVKIALDKDSYLIAKQNGLICE